MSERDDLTAWLQLMLTEGVGSQTARELLGRFGLPDQILAAGFPALQKCVSEKIALALSSQPDAGMRAQIKKRWHGRIKQTTTCLHWPALIIPAHS